MPVVDASAAVDFLIRRGPRGRWVAQQVSGDLIHAPHLIDVEIASVLRRFVRRAEVPAAAAERALDAVPELVSERYAMVLLLPRIFALRHVLSAYDAAYVALAEALELPLVTTDTRLARAQGHRAKIVAYSA